MYFRHPHTTQELRANEDARSQGIRIRGRRLLLPTDFDDLMVGRCAHRSWKRYRRTQWRPR